MSNLVPLFSVHGSLLSQINDQRVVLTRNLIRVECYHRHLIKQIAQVNLLHQMTTAKYANAGEAKNKKSGGKYAIAI